MSVQYNAKREYLQSEGDAYFERNFEAQKRQKTSTGVGMFYDFVCNQMGGGVFL